MNTPIIPDILPTSGQSSFSTKSVTISPISQTSTPLDAANPASIISFGGTNNAPQINSRLGYTPNSYISTINVQPVNTLQSGVLSSLTYSQLQSTTQKRQPRAIEAFVDRLAKWAGSIPLQHFWVVEIDFNSTFKNNLNKWVEILSKDGVDEEPWSLFNSDIINKLTEDSYQRQNLDGDAYTLGCYFARSISIPGERIETTNLNTNLQTGGLLFPSILNKRSAATNLQISFMETNASFVDSVIRPWSIISSYAGSVARMASDLQPPKTTITATFYSKLGKLNTVQNNTKLVELDYSSSIRPRKKIIFKNAVPVSVAPQEHTQAGEALQVRPVDFIYTSYKLDTTDAVAAIDNDES